MNGYLCWHTLNTQPYGIFIYIYPFGKYFLCIPVMYQTGPGEIEQEISQQIICLSPLQWALESQRLYFSCLWPQFLHIADIQSCLLKKGMTEQACEESIISICKRGNGLNYFLEVTLPVRVKTRLDSCPCITLKPVFLQRDITLFSCDSDAACGSW